MPSPTMLERIAGWPWEEALAVVFACAWGGMLGSFLNVLAHRVPLGRTPVTGRSSCPRCGAPVRFCDNVPVVGWLVLRGRCRDCRGPIPVSYLLVEAGCAAAAATLAAAGLMAAGGAEPLLRGDLMPLGRWALHLAAVITVVARSLLAGRLGASSTGRADDRPPTGPWPTLVPLAIAWGVAWTAPACGPEAWPESWPWPRAAAARAVLAAAAGSLAGWAWGAAWTRSTRGSLAILGSVLGWQGVTVVTVVTVVTAFATTASRGLRDPRRLGLLAAAAATATAAGITVFSGG